MGENKREKEREVEIKEERGRRFSQRGDMREWEGETRERDENIFYLFLVSFCTDLW